MSDATLFAMRPGLRQGETTALTSSPSANVTAACPQDEEDEPSAVGCVTGRACAPATLGLALLVLLVGLAIGLALCGWIYKRKDGPDEASPLVGDKGGTPKPQQEYRCNPGCCIAACLGCCIRD